MLCEMVGVDCCDVWVCVVWCGDCGGVCEWCVGWSVLWCVVYGCVDCVFVCVCDGFEGDCVWYDVGFVLLYVV